MDIDRESIKTYRISSEVEDSDTHNYTTFESESMATEDQSEAEPPVEPTTFEKYSIWIAEMCKKKSTWLFFFNFIFIIISFFSWKTMLKFKDRNNVEREVRVGETLLIFVFILLSYMLVEFVLSKITFFAMKKSRRLNGFFYYVHELAAHISLGFFLLCGIVIISFKEIDYCIDISKDLGLYLSDACTTFLVTDVLLALLKIAHKAVSVDFNYSVYIRRIRKVLFEEALVSLFTETESKKGSKREMGNNGLMEPTYKNNQTIIDEILGDLGIFSDPIDELELPIKRLILKEFQRLFRSPYSLTRKDVLQSSQRLRNKAVNKASKIVERDRFLPPMSRYAFFFPKIEIFKQFIREMGLSESYRFNRYDLAEFIERSYKERYLLKENLEHMNSAIDKVVFAFKLTVYAVTFLVLYIEANRGDHGPNTVGIITAIFSTQFISNSFFGSFIESIIFLFFIHPYDIGDRVLININNEEQNLVVSELNVFSTVFYRWDGTYITILNTTLAKKSISNLRRSGIMAESHTIQINSRTSQKKIVKLKELIENFVKNNPEDYTEYIMLNYEKLENVVKLHLKVYMQYKTNWQNFELYLKRKTKFLSYVNRAMQELEIEYVLPPLRVSVKSNPT